jgi:hypothetical protein
MGKGDAMSLDDLRRSAGGFEDTEQDDVVIDDFDADVREERTLFLGMTPVERMFLSMFLFMNVLVLGVALLLVTGRLVL